MNTPLHIPADVAQDIAASHPLVEAAHALTVDSGDAYAAAGAQIREIARMRKVLEEKRLSMTRPLDQTKKEIMALFKHPDDSLGEAEGIISRKMLAYKAEQDRARREAEAAAAEAARKERERLEKQAAAAVRRGQEEKAAALQEAAASVPAAPVVHVPQASAEGVSTRVVWRWEIADRASLPAEYLIPDEKAIGAMVRARGADTAIPGVRVWPEETLVKRTA